MTGSIPRIIITPGEPAGIGPDITVQLAEREWDANVICVCDPELLLSRAKQLSIPLTLELFDSAQIKRHRPGILNYIPIKLQASCTPGKLNVLNAHYVIECLKIATDFCLKSNAGLVTGPIHKSIINEAGIPFTGHTEFLAQQCQSSHPIMLFVVNQLRVALATTHIALSKVSESISAHALLNTLRMLHAELKSKFKLSHPKILVCGLNPHAGENGHLGREEIEIITPVIYQLRNENINAIGPLPADTIFTEKYLKTADAVLAMYHDQALPVVKYMSFGHAVNVTLGLPIIRTSVDHGTALDIAGTNQSDPGSMVAAVQLAIELLGSASNKLN